MIVENPEEAIDILDMSLHGMSYKEIGAAVGKSQSRCAVLAYSSVRMLRSVPYTSNEPMPPHNCFSWKERQAHKEFWLRQIDYARGLQLRVPPPGTLREIASDAGRIYGLGATQVLRVIKRFEAAILDYSRGGPRYGQDNADRQITPTRLRPEGAEYNTETPHELCRTHGDLRKRSDG
ncbi:MAG: hypothetical protein ACJ8R9_21950 [Steroidobacteraceae bacterium]